MNEMVKDGMMKGGMISRLLRTGIVLGAMAASGFAGYKANDLKARIDQKTLSALSLRPVAPGALDVPDTYSFEIRVNSDGQRAAFMTGPQDYRLPEEMPEILSAYQKDPARLDKMVDSINADVKYKFFK